MRLANVTGKLNIVVTKFYDSSVVQAGNVYQSNLLMIFFLIVRTVTTVNTIR